MTGDAYLPINPMGEGPAIVHRGHVVTECAAICAYLADAFPDSGLAPPPADRADYYRWLFFAAGPVEQAVTNKALHAEATPEQSRMLGYGSYDLAVDVLEQARLLVAIATALSAITSAPSAVRRKLALAIGRRT